MKSFENFVWLASYPKSGNTWLRIFLNTIINKYERDFSINEIGITDGIVASRAKFEKWVGVDSQELTKTEIDNYLPEVLVRRAKSLNDRSYIKTHTANVKNQRGIQLFPNEVTEKVIYLVRNPLDVCVSMAFHSGHMDFEASIKTINSSQTILADSAIEFYAQMHQYLGDWSSHYQSWNNNFPSEKKLIVRYEDMKLDEEETFSRILTFLGIEVTHQHLIEVIKTCSFSNLKSQENEEGFKERPSESKSFFRKGIVGDWKEYLNQDQVTRIIDIHGKVMRELGYMKDNNTLLI